MFSLTVSKHCQMKLLIFLLSISAIACTSNSNADYLEYVDGKQLLNLNDIQRNGDKLEIPEIATIIPDSIFVDDHVKIQITLNSGNSGLN